MRFVPLIISTAVTVALVLLFNTKLLLPAPLGKLLSPQHGIWQNAEKADISFDENFVFPGLRGTVDVYLDERLVPHVFATEEDDVYFVQGYLHAKFRLWQMELQTHAAAGRAGEIVGNVALQHDREFRRLGMVYAAEASLKAAEADPLTKSSCDAYTAGVNAYIESLTESSLPLEYKLMGYKPEKWSNLKSALFLKNMSENLAGYDDDFEMTNARDFFSKSDFAKLYPYYQDSVDPIIPSGTQFKAPGILPLTPATADSIYFRSKAAVVNTTATKPDKSNGSNNWAVAGGKTASGSPILCNDPHLGLNLPSLWFEIQLSTPKYSVYGVSFPGAPGVVIGYNEHIAWGVTNGGRDVRDYFEIKFKDESRQEYWYDSAWQKTQFRYETIRVKDSLSFIDTVAYTVFGPVMYDARFSGNRTTNTANYAVRWKAHDPSNELKTFLLLNRASDYQGFLGAVSNMQTPGQNFVYASKTGDIALRTQGDWPAKWKGQGDFIMPGTDSSYNWQAMIPFDETPFQYNPERRYVSSANQPPADSTYPYYVGRDYPVYRGIIINRLLDSMQNITAKDMMQLQNNNFNQFAAMAAPLLLRKTITAQLNEIEQQYFNYVKDWNYENAIESKAATIFNMWWAKFDQAVFDDDFANAPKVIKRPYESSLLEGVLKEDSSYRFVDNILTSEVERLEDIATLAFKNAVEQLANAAQENRLDWGNYKATGVYHLTRLAPFSRLNLPIGGGTHCINAAKSNHGPSWRMVIDLSGKTTGYGVYPGGQSGNPGSKFYDDFIDDWAAGKYYDLWLMRRDEQKDARIKWKMSFSKKAAGA